MQFGVDTDDARYRRPRLDRPLRQHQRPDDRSDERGLQSDAEILAVRIWVRVRAERLENGFTDTTTYVYADQNVGPFNDGFRRLVVSKTIYLRNARPAVMRMTTMNTRRSLANALAGSAQPSDGRHADRRPRAAARADGRRRVRHEHGHDGDHDGGEHAVPTGRVPAGRGRHRHRDRQAAYTTDAAAHRRLARHPRFRSPRRDDVPRRPEHGSARQQRRRDRRVSLRHRVGRPRTAQRHCRRTPRVSTSSDAPSEHVSGEST